ncbi:D-arabinono-1,4-lactone oxidase [Planctomonas psychrotolerans]|uniref:D-arabinono-1,4-lactone oxidase n=1 Tax=Planctomonas psychrotolerans TaxID=2528712 RepID=UPI00123BC3F6|nr:D-arabinono-1,4-lactone oxidase [Planctomonas psychrotolerans]
MTDTTVGTRQHNWSDNYTYRAESISRPSSLEELRDIVSTAPRVRVLGSRHSFNDIADSGRLVELGGLPEDIRVDRSAGTVTFNAGLRYGQLAPVLESEGLALANLASLPHISVGGAVATATHGSGNRNGNLATSVAGLTLVTSDGGLLEATRGDADFDGLVVNLGALGVVASITLDVEPAYEVRQRVFDNLPWESLYENFEAITGSGYSVSMFTRFDENVDMVWLKTRVTAEDEVIVDEFYGATAADANRHPIPGLSAERCTPQLGEPGPWWERLPHFVMGFTPSNGDEIQSEFIVPKEHAAAALSAVRGLADEVVPLLQVCEVRTMAGDDLWMSPQYGRESVGLHFTWVKDQAAVERVAASIEEALRPFDARPHWGKVFTAGAADIAPLYPRLTEFTGLVQKLDARGAFRNEWLERHVLGA